MNTKTNMNVKDGFQQLAFGSIADAMLLLNGDSFTKRQLSRMNLMNIEQIKKSDKGGVEIKFFDRNKALQMLAVCDDEESYEGIEKLYKAIAEAGKE